jgi:hypothetical protein
VTGESDSRAAAWKQAHDEEIDDEAALAFHARLSWGLERALALLGAAGVPVLVVKGAILAHLLYDSPVERPLRDVDLRVRPRDLDRAKRALLAAPGTRLLVASSVYRSAVISMRGVELDLEATIGPPFLSAVGVDAMLARAELAVEPLGFAHARPEIHDHALVLAINVFKDHVLPGAAGVEDLVRIARRPEFDARTLAERARDAGCTTLVHVVATHVARTRRDERLREIASLVTPRRPRYAARVLRALGESADLSTLRHRIELRAAADGRVRAIAAVTAAAAMEASLAIEDYWATRAPR